MNPVENTYMFFAFLVVSLWMVQPEELFDKNQKMKNFGTTLGSDSTPAPVWLVLLILTGLFYKHEILHTRN